MTKKNRYLFMMIGIFLSVGLAFVLGAEADVKGEPVTHTGCKIADKPMTVRGKNQIPEPYHYHVDSTCGKFLANKDLYDEIVIDETYDLVTTAGNWAHKPTLLSSTLTY